MHKYLTSVLVSAFIAVGLVALGAFTYMFVAWLFGELGTAVFVPMGIYASLKSVMCLGFTIIFVFLYESVVEWLGGLAAVILASLLVFEITKYSPMPLAVRVGFGLLVGLSVALGITARGIYMALEEGEN